MKSVNHSGGFDLLIRDRDRTGKSPAVFLVYSFHFSLTFLAVTDIISAKKREEKEIISIWKRSSCKHQRLSAPRAKEVRGCK